MVGLNIALLATKDGYKVRWTLHPSGWLELRYQYQQGGPRELLSVIFAYPEARVTGVRRLVDGPYRVWKNRLRGTTLGPVGQSLQQRRNLVVPRVQGLLRQILRGPGAHPRGRFYGALE